MEDLEEELAEAFGMERFEQNVSFQSLRPKLKPLATCAGEDCRSIVIPRRRFCDTCKAEKDRESVAKRTKTYRERQKARLSAGEHRSDVRVSDAVEPTNKPSHENEISRPHSDHGKRPVFGCLECIRRARATEDSLPRNSR